mmetsp:Transcript_83783/g.147548  ORF Transcript_83783/g.147548 Transcript_83783/m.147548 type:complete len:152 (-) Transcript_83783:143-598(-)
MFPTATVTGPTVTVQFGSSLTAKTLRRALLKDLLGLPEDTHPKTMVTTPLQLTKTARIELAATKVKSIWDDVRDKVPPEALSYFPKPAEPDDDVAAQASQASQASQGMPPPRAPSSSGRRRPGPKPTSKPVDKGTRSIAVMFQRLQQANSR